MKVEMFITLEDEGSLEEQLIHLSDLITAIHAVDQEVHVIIEGRLTI